MNESPANRAVVLKNESCVYCGIELESSNADTDHVIARRFVPRGKLDAQWNLIVRACKHCNGLKSDLEDDISAISMQPDAAGEQVRPDAVLASEAARKAANCFSRRTHNAVKDSSEKINLTLPLARGIQMNFFLTSPPQMDWTRAFELSRLQGMAFFYWLTYSEVHKRGGYWPGSFFPISLVRKADWGNGLQKGFMDLVADWDIRLLAATAAGFFKVAVRRHPAEVLWSWALEWNQNYRVIGFFGEPKPAEKLAAALPVLKTTTLCQNSELGLGMSYRKEAPLAEEDDKLFSVNG